MLIYAAFYACMFLDYAETPRQAAKQENHLPSRKRVLLASSAWMHISMSPS